MKVQNERDTKIIIAKIREKVTKFLGEDIDNLIVELKQEGVSDPENSATIVMMSACETFTTHLTKTCKKFGGTINKIYPDSGNKE